MEAKVSFPRTIVEERTIRRAVINVAALAEGEAMTSVGRSRGFLEFGAEKIVRRAVSTTK